jgi:hypothetical protein
MDVYLEANAIALAPCCSLKLAIALNLSVFYYEIMEDAKSAITLAEVTI